MSRTARRFSLALPILGCFGGGSLYGWSGYLPAVRATYGVGNAVASMVFSLALASFTLGVLLGPAIFAGLPQRFRLSATAALAAVGLSLSGAGGGFAVFVLCYGFCFGFASGALYNHAISQATASKAADFFVPVSVAAFGLGGAVFGPTNVWLTAKGWALWSMLPALVCLVTVALVAPFIRFSSENDTTRVQESAPFVKPDKTIAVLWLIFAAGSCSGLIVLGFASQILHRGAEDAGLASAAIFLAALGNTLGRLSTALIASKFGPACGIAGSLVLSIVALLGLIITVSPGKVVVLLFVVAFAYGHLAANTPLLVKSQVSAPAFPSSFGWVFTGWGFAGLVGPWAAGWLMDTTGDLQRSLIICIALAAVSLWLVARFQRPNRIEEDC